MTEAQAPVKKDYGWILPVTGAAIGLTAVGVVGYYAYKFFSGFKMPNLNPFQSTSQQEMLKAKVPYVDTWKKNQFGIEVDIHKYSATGAYEVRVKAPTHPVAWPATGLNYIIVYAFSGAVMDAGDPFYALKFLQDPGYASAKNAADKLTQAEINAAMKGIVPGEVPQLIHGTQAKAHADTWMKNRYGIQVDFHQYSKTKQWEVRIKAPTHPAVWPQNNMNYIVVYAYPKIEQAALAASNIDQAIVNQAMAKATPTENPVLMTSGFGRIGFQVGNRIIFQR